MDSLEQLLKEYDYGVRVSFENRWLVWDNGGWLVLERKYQARRNTVLYEGNLLTAAISTLIKETDDGRES